MVGEQHTHAKRARDSSRRLPERTFAHKQGRGSTFTSRYKINQLVYYEPYGDIENAIQREKTLKTWKRQYKINLIEQANPNWADLYESLNA